MIMKILMTIKHPVRPPLFTTYNETREFLMNNNITLQLPYLIPYDYDDLDLVVYL